MTDTPAAVGNTNETTAASPVSTTTTTTKQQPPSSTTTNNKGRRSARVHKRDPIVAPGFGTQQDLTALSQNLGLPLVAVKAIMESRGRGIRSSSRSSDHHDNAAAAAPPTPISTAWADFMKEEGVNLHAASTSSSTATAAAIAEETTTTTTTTAAAGSRSSSGAAATTTDNVPRVYDLPLQPTWMKTSSSNDSEPAQKKAKLVAEQQEDSSGILVQTGTLDAASVGRVKRTFDQPYDLMAPTILLSSNQQQIKKVITGCNAAHSICISSDGTVYGWGRNEAQQLSSELPTNVALPTVIEAFSDAEIVDGAVGKSHSLLLDSNGQVWACGSNKCGQCGIKSSMESVPNFRKCVLPKHVKMVQVACGEQFSVALSDQGHLYTTGSAEFGQLANGETGEYFVTASKLAFANCNVFTRRLVFCHAPGEKTYGSSSSKDIKVIPLDDEPEICLAHVSCGKHHAVAIEAPTKDQTHPPRVFSWGCGDYGCLGHGVQADEYYPRLIGSLNNMSSMFQSNPPVSTAAGAHCSMVLTRNGHVYYWGKHRSVGEATMRPALLEALANNGHVVRHVGGGSQTVFCSTANAVTVSWGQGPHGELGYGEKQKSSSKPNFVSSLDKCRVMDLACGYGHTLLIVRKEDADDEAALQQLRTLDPTDVAALEAP